MIFAFLYSYGIGANDVSNLFGAAVGSKALNLKQAVLIATVCEFLGAFLMGSSTADTIKGGLIDVDLFAAQPELLMLGMACSLVGSSTWVLFASLRRWPVSTTHAIVGAITGIGLAGFGSNAVTTFIFWVTKFLILRHENSLKRGLTAIPFYFAITIFINVFNIIFKGSPGLSLSKLPIGSILGISFGVAGAVFLWRASVHVETAHPTFHEKSGKMASSSPHLLSPDGAKIKNLEEALRSPCGSVNSGLAALDDTPAPSKGKALFNKLKAKLTYGLNQDIGDNGVELDQIHDNSTRYDANTEKLFCTLQVLTSCFASFAHGSNDVANAIGPLMTIYYVWRNGAVDITGKAPIPSWILAYGGIAIDTGLLTYDYIHLPSRGFSVSLDTSLTVLTCSKLGLPVSTTHCITGATTAVGLCSGGSVKSVNWKMLGLVASSWIFTLPAAGL
ncbi:hypothetical protein BGW39_006738, partial [Mortierella sp. 14UC]